MTGPEAPRRRLAVRWLTLGEGVGVAAVLISGLGLYNSWNDKAPPPPAAAARKASPLVLKANVERDGARLALAPLEAGQAVQSQRLIFPKILGLAPVETTGSPAIERATLAEALVRARRTAGKADETTSQERLPLLIVTRFIEDGAVHEDRAIYDAAYTIGHSFLTGSHVRLHGLAFVMRIASEADGQARIDARTSLKPVAKP